MAVRILALLFLTFWACSSPKKRILTREFPASVWVFPDTIWGELSVSASGECFDIELGITVEDNYPWRNLYTLVFIESPDGFRSQSRINLVFSDTLGNWYEPNRKFRTLVARRTSFASAGTYRFGLLPYIRSDSVYGVREVSLYAESCSSAE